MNTEVCCVNTSNLLCIVERENVQVALKYAIKDTAYCRSYLMDTHQWISLDDLFDTEMVATGTQCLTTRKPYYLIDVKTKDQWDTNDSRVAELFPDYSLDLSEEFGKMAVSSMQEL